MGWRAVGGGVLRVKTQTQKEEGRDMLYAAREGNSGGGVREKELRKREKDEKKKDKRDKLS